MSHNQRVLAAFDLSRRLALLRVLADVPGEHRLRQQILRLLGRLPGFSANSSELDAALDACGLHVSREAVRAAGAWLAQHALVTREDIGPVDVLTATRLGLDIADGTAFVPGVAQPATIPWLHSELQRWGISAGRNQVVAWVGYLAEGGMVMSDDQIAITEYGEDVAAGRDSDPGVAVPSPRV